MSLERNIRWTLTAGWLLAMVAGPWLALPVDGAPMLGLLGGGLLGWWLLASVARQPAPIFTALAGGVGLLAGGAASGLHWLLLTGGAATTTLASLPLWVVGGGLIGLGVGLVRWGWLALYPPD